MEWNGREISAKKKGEIPKHSQTKKVQKISKKERKNHQRTKGTGLVDAYHDCVKGFPGFNDEWEGEEVRDQEERIKIQKIKIKKQKQLENFGVVVFFPTPGLII